MLTNLTPPPFCGPIILHKKQATDFFTSQPAIEIEIVANHRPPGTSVLIIRLSGTEVAGAI